MATRRKAPSRWGAAVAGASDVFAADLRSLAAFRIVLALLVLADLAIRIPNLFVHYADGGILPRSVLLERQSIWQFSLNVANGTVQFQALVFAITALAAVAMLVGYRTRLATVVTWVLVVSIQFRNPYIGSAADQLLRALLFWSMFLPLGRWWSVDRSRAPRPVPGSLRVVSMATAALFLQIAMMYWFTAILKSADEWRVDGTALYYTLSGDQWTSPMAAVLLQLPPDVLKVMTFATLVLEVVAPILLFSPVWTGPVRTAAAVAIMSLHFGIWLTLAIGLFPWLSAFAMVCFLPTWFWESVVPWIRAALLDRWGTASGVAHAVGRLTTAADTRRWPRPGLPHVFGSAAFAGGGAYAHPNAAAGGSSGLGVPPADRSRASSPPAPRTIHASPVANLLAACFLAFVFVWNVAGVASVGLAEPLRAVGLFFGLNQHWVMFAPRPAINDVWYTVPGTLQDGRQIDLMGPTLDDDADTQTPFSWDRPPDIPATYNNDDRWRKYFDTMAEDDSDDLRLAFGRYVCRNWNQANTGTQSALMTFDIVQLRQRNLEEGKHAPTEREVLWSHTC